MKLLSFIIALAVFGQVVPAFGAVCALCRLAQNSLSDFFLFRFIQNLCCQVTLDGSGLVASSASSGGGISCVYGKLVPTGTCYYVSTQISAEWQMSHALDRMPMECAIIAVVNRVAKALFVR